MELQQSIKDIIRVNENIRDFWGNGGWAPSGAAELLSKSRLDWQVSLSKNLLRWFPFPKGDEYDGSLILAWANLGALVEATMKWYLCVFYEDYSLNPFKKKGEAIEPDELWPFKLYECFLNNVWVASEKKQWEPFVILVRERRNSIHAYKDRSIGSFEEFTEAVIRTYPKTYEKPRFQY